jgi:hypothetical protein
MGAIPLAFTWAATVRHAALDPALDHGDGGEFGESVSSSLDGLFGASRVIRFLNGNRIHRPAKFIARFRYCR